MTTETKGTAAERADVGIGPYGEKRRKLQILLSRIFRRRGQLVVLGAGALSDKIVLVGELDHGFGFLRVCEYKDGKLHDYGETITEDMVGEPITTIIFGSKDGIAKMSDALRKLHVKMEGGE